MIRFMAPDLPHPSGGIKVIYNYVEHLVRPRLRRARLARHPGFRVRRRGSRRLPSTPAATCPSRLEMSWSCPETGGSKWSFLSGENPVVVLCQGMDFVFSASDFLRDEPGAYPGWPNATATMAVSTAIDTFLERACPPGFPVHRVPVEIEDRFQPLAKERRIALMPRRRREDLIGAVQLMRRSGRIGRLGVRAHRRDDAGPGGRRARPGGHLLVRCRA